MTITLEREARRNVGLFTAGNFSADVKPKMTFGKTKNADGVEVDALLMTDVPVFRSGVFRDSMGFQHTWESIHMDQMVAHFDLLKNRGILDSIPVRKGHGSFLSEPMDGLIGWHTGLRTKEMKNPTDGADYLYLMADYEILDREAMDKISSGLWRNRSAEVGSYVTNAEAEFWPVYMGVAYVDFSAVEGLNVYNQSSGIGTQFSLMFEDAKEAPVAGTDSTQGTPAQAPPAAAPATPAVAPVAPVAPHTSVPQTDTSDHSRPAAPSTAAFTLNGKQVTDPAAVQAHINVLEAFQKESGENARKDFLKNLAEGPAPKISAAQIPGLEAFALGLSDDQWKAYVASWDAAPAAPLLGLHAASVQQGSTTISTAPATPAAELDNQIQVAEGVIEQFRLQGKRDSDIQKMGVYTRLQSLRTERAKIQ